MDTKKGPREGPCEGWQLLKVEQQRKDSGQYDLADECQASPLGGGGAYLRKMSPKIGCIIFDPH